MSDCNWLNIAELTQYYSLMQLWKTIHWKRPDDLWRKLQEEDGGFLSTDQPRLRMTSAAFRCKTVLQWNLLSAELKVENTLSRFKIGLKKWIIRRRPVTGAGIDGDRSDGDTDDG